MPSTIFVDGVSAGRVKKANIEMFQIAFSTSIVDVNKEEPIRVATDNVIMTREIAEMLLKNLNMVLKAK
jgi:hypothetical protein